jgi:hypothetical protein
LAPPQGKHTKNRSLCVSTKLLVLFVIFRAFVGFLHDMAPSAQRFVAITAPEVHARGPQATGDRSPIPLGEFS